MEETSKLFSESWHRVAGYSIQLRPEVTVHKQRFRGQWWYVIREPYNNQFFRVRSGAYAFIARLRHGGTVQDAWQTCMEMDPEEAPGQEEVVQLIGQLYQNNLISSNLPPDSEQLFQRFKKRQQKEFQGKLKSFLTPRFTLLNPDSFLRVCVPYFRPLFGWTGLAIWAAVVLWGLNTALANFDELRSQTAGALNPDNWLALFMVSLVAKSVHEFGHALFCRVQGGQVHKLGVILLLFTLVPVPLPFVDASSSYAFRSKRGRMLVAAGGMVFEFFLAAVVCLIWARTGDGELKRWMYNLLLVSSVHTLIFNINPLLKFDGYYLLSEWLDMPNLQERAQKQLTHLIEKYAFDLSRTVSSADTNSEAWLLSLFGVAAFLYKILLIYVITNLVAGSFLGLGYLIALVLLLLWVALPLWKAVDYLINSPKLFMKRSRALTWTLSVVMVVGLLVSLVPLPRHFQAPGIVLAADRVEIYAETDGYITEITAESGARVVQGELLGRLANADLDERLAIQEAEIRRLIIEKERFQIGQFSRLPALQNRIAAAEDRARYLSEQRDSLLIRAPRDGIWIPLDADHLMGTLLVKGDQIGEIILPGNYLFRAVVAQENASSLFNQEIRRSEVRLTGRPGRIHTVREMKFIPAEQDVLPSPALGWRGGGDVEVDNQDPSGVKAKRPFYTTLSELEEHPEGGLQHHRTGYVRCHLTWEPALTQGLRWLRQILQEKHKI